MFYCTIPAGIERRYCIVLIPPVLVLANAGAARIASWSGRFGKFGFQQSSIMAATAILFFAFSFTIPAKTNSGYANVAGAIASAGKPAMVLVSTETLSGEGVFTAEMAMRRNSGNYMILRASKALADEDWGNTSYHARYTDAEQLRGCLNDVHPDYLVLDTTRTERRYVHHEQLLALVSTHPEEWQFAGSFTGDGRHSEGGIKLFQNLRPPIPGHVLSRLRTNLHGRFGTWPIKVTLACGVEAAGAPGR
jgi:hypothetical protein